MNRTFFTLSFLISYQDFEDQSYDQFGIQAFESNEHNTFLGAYGGEV